MQQKAYGKKKKNNILPTRLLEKKEKKNSWWPEFNHAPPQEWNGRPLINCDKGRFAYTMLIHGPLLLIWFYWT